MTVHFIVCTFACVLLVHLDICEQITEHWNCIKSKHLIWKNTMLIKTDL